MIDPFLSAANLADACLRIEADYHCPIGLRPAAAGMRLAGPALPVTHAGSVDSFLEALSRAATGDILVVDNGGRLDEGCIGDLTVLEAAHAGLGGIVIWGCHRDHAQIVDIGLPLFSLGHHPSGPRGADGRRAAVDAVVDGFLVERGSLVAADDDGAILLKSTGEGEIAQARSIRDIEARQADEIRRGRSLRSQLKFDDYLEARDANPDFSLREHLRHIGGAIET